MVFRCENFNITNIVCGPEHRISIGSPGKDGDQNDVTDISVRNCMFHSSSNGVRIKTWASPGIGKVSNLIYEDIFMNHVDNPLIIDQEYCPYPPCNQHVILISFVLIVHCVKFNRSEILYAKQCWCSRIVFITY